MTTFNCFRYKAHPLADLTSLGVQRPAPLLQCSLTTNADIVSQPQVTARRVDQCVPSTELRQRDPRIRIYRPAAPAAVTVLN
jgi:hypothetical protein